MWVGPWADEEQRVLSFSDVEDTALDSRQKVHTSDPCHGKVFVISMLSSRISEVRLVPPLQPPPNADAAHRCTRAGASRANACFLPNPC